MFDETFVFDECGFGWVPDWIRRDLLFNVSFDLADRSVKLYVLHESREFVYKIGDRTIARQYHALAGGADPARLAGFLGADLAEEEVTIDTVEGDTYYVFIEDSPPSSYNKFLNLVCRRYGVSKSRFVEVVNRINARKFPNLYECGLSRAVSMVRVPLGAGGCKIYSRPFKTGNSFELGPEATRFFARLYHCPATSLPDHLTYMWASSELLTDRIVVTAQHHRLLHRV
jgi:hypothetical protein